MGNEGIMEKPIQEKFVEKGPKNASIPALLGADEGGEVLAHEVAMIVAKPGCGGHVRRNVNFCDASRTTERFILLNRVHQYLLLHMAPPAIQDMSVHPNKLPHSTPPLLLLVAKLPGDLVCFELEHQLNALK